MYLGCITSDSVLLDAFLPTIIVTMGFMMVKSLEITLSGANSIFSEWFGTVSNNTAVRSGYSYLDGRCVG